jgi:polyhydroxyalkanoate synthesis regulator phasin
MDDRKQMEERLRAAGVGFTFTEAVRVVTAVRRGDMTLDQALEQIPAAMTYEQIEKVVDTYRGSLTPADGERRALGTPQGAKMTPDEVADLKQELADGTANNGHLRKALAHIAALEAERDEALTQAKGHRLAEALARVSRRMREVLEVEDDSRHSPGVVEAAQALVSERNALRERVKALEQDADAAQATLEDEQAAHAETLGRMSAAESTLSAFRQRAGDDSALNRAIGDEARATYASEAGAGHAMEPRGWLWTRWAKAVARYILGEDGAGVDVLHPGGRCTCAGEGTCAWCSRTRCIGCGAEGVDLCQACDAEAKADQGATAASEPTMAEAFAAVRKVAEVSKHPRFMDALASLSLLEGRMGAMARAIREVLDSKAWMPQFKALQDALTDAPPVFTLEEVERLAAEHCSAGDASRLVRALAALRSTGGGQ